MEQMIHWKKTKNSNYIGTQDFDYDKNGKAEDIIVTINEVKIETITGEDKKKSIKTVLYFKENYKPLVMNTTNSKTMLNLTEKKFATQWEGCKIQLYVLDGVKAFGTVTDGVRIRPFLPKSTIPCEDCNQPIKPANNMTAESVASRTKGKYGRNLCASCGAKAKLSQDQQKEGAEDGASNDAGQ